MRLILNQLRYSARTFSRTPGTTLALLFTVALGIAANVTIHGFARGLTNPSLVAASLRGVVSVFGRDRQGEPGPLSHLEYQALKNRRDAFEWIGAARVSPTVVALDGQPQTVTVAALTSDLARLFDIPLQGGVVISRRLWRNVFGEATGLAGHTVRIHGASTPAAGIAAEKLEGLYRDRPVDLWMALPDTDHADGRDLWVIAKLRHGASFSHAQMTMQLYTGVTPKMAADLSRVATLLDLASAAVFFVACANVASFMLGRALARSHEVCLRIALGASRGRLAGELLSDSFVISAAGGAAGMLLSAWWIRALPALLFEPDAARLVFASDLMGILLVSAACAGVTLLCGLLPVWAIPYDRPAMVMRRESAGASPSTRRLRAGLVVAQMTSCCVLVIAAAHMMEGFRTALRTAAWHGRGSLVLATVQAHPDVSVDYHYFEQVERSAQSLGVVSPLAWTVRLPGDPPMWQSFRIEQERLPLREVTLDVDWLTPNTLDLLKLPLKAGRMFGLGDRACRTVIVNEQAAEKLFGGQTTGRTVQDDAGARIEVIGVAAFRKANRPAIYYNRTDQAVAAPRGMGLAHFNAAAVSELTSVELDANVVSASYFRTMGFALVAGQSFDRPIPGACRIAVVNREADNLYFGGSAIGAAVIDDQGRRTEIVGIVHSPAIGAFQARREPAIYFPMPQDVLPRMTLLLSAPQHKAPLLADLRRIVEAVPGRGPAPIVVETLETHLARTALATLRIATVIVGAAAAAALLLSVLALFGALNDAARQRRRELAIRIALGAQRWRVAGHVLAEGARLASGGIVAGMFGSLLLSRLLTRITPVDTVPALWVWLSPPLVLAAAVTLAGILPARRAMLNNPLSIMRENH